MDPEAVKAAIAAQFKGKEKLVPAQLRGARMGREWAMQNCPARSG